MYPVVVNDATSSKDDEAPRGLDKRAVAFALWDALWLGFAMGAAWAPFELWVLGVKHAGPGFTISYRYRLDIAGGGGVGWFVILLGLATLTRRLSLPASLTLRIAAPICAVVAGLAWVMLAPRYG